MSPTLKRYQRQIQLPDFGKAGQEKLSAAKILIIGAGGLGCPLLLSLVSAGVGNISIIDHDTVDESNLARQILFSENDLGKNKALVAQEKLQELNPHISIKAYAQKFNSAIAKEITPDYDFLIDCSDNFPTRYLVNDACVEFNKPFISASLLNFSAQISVYNLNGSGTYRCLFPEASNSQNCTDAGIINSVTSATAAILANECYKLITGDTHNILADKLLCINFKNYSQNILIFKRLSTADIRRIQKDEYYAPAPCATSQANEISPKEAYLIINSNNKHTLLDVRNPEEKELLDIGGKLIPLSELANRTAELDKSKIVLIYCQKGLRGQKACTLLRSYGFPDVLNISGGIENFLKENSPS